MNVFYERLLLFGELVAEAEQNEEDQLSDYFTVQHPGHPIIMHTKSTAPKLSFVANYPAGTRQKVRKLMRKAFNRIKDKF